MFSNTLKLAVLLAVGVFHVAESIDLGRAHSRHRRDITLSGLNAKEEMRLNVAEKMRFEAFKKKISSKLTCPNMKKDIYLVKFFKYGEMNVDKAMEAILEAIDWRKANKIDAISKEDLVKDRKRFESHTDGTDIEGRPIMYMQAGKWGLATAFTKKEDKAYERVFYQLFEESAAKTVAAFEAGKKNAQYVNLVNYDDWTTEEGACVDCVELVSRLAIAYQSYYPRFGHKVILYNTTPDFHLFLDLIRIVLSVETNEKLVVFDRERAQWEPEITKLIEKAALDKIMAQEKFLE